MSYRREMLPREVRPRILIDKQSASRCGADGQITRGNVPTWDLSDGGPIPRIVSARTNAALKKQISEVPNNTATNKNIVLAALACAHV